MSAGWRPYLQLHKKKKRQEERKFIIEGVRLCQEALRSGWETEIAFISEDFTRSEHWEQFAEHFRLKKIPWRALAPAQFRQLADTETPQGVLMVLRMPSYLPEQLNLRKASFVVLLQGVRDPGNLGAIIRTADWYGAGAVILSPDCVDPFNPKVLRGTMGSIFHLPVYSTPDLSEEIRRLKESRFRIIASSLHGKTTLQTARFRKPAALLLGGEAFGLTPDLEAQADDTVRIWKYGQAESLNVAIAGGIFMDHIAGQLSKTPRKR